MGVGNALRWAEAGAEILMGREVAAARAKWQFRGQWALAMRYGGQKQARKFSWGAKWPPPEQSGNFADRSAIELVPSILPAYDDGYASTAPVGSFKPNSLGIYDGGGNVAEWVNDFYTVPTPGITTPVAWCVARVGDMPG
jgi:formylglycine-generating enzyme required for sulfatase activity